MILATLAHVVVLVRAEEAWEPVVFGGLIPMVGALAVVFLIWYAVREPDKEDEEGDEGPGEPPPPGPSAST
jgi:hypothetical protein